jgi:hypothetical protein
LLLQPQTGAKTAGQSAPLFAVSWQSFLQEVVVIIAAKKIKIFNFFMMKRVYAMIFEKDILNKR